MRLDFATLAFGYQVLAGGNTPNWSTSLGQGKDHKISNSTEIDELLKGMIYTCVPVSNVQVKMGRGGNLVTGNDPGAPISLASVFNKVYINDILIDGESFVLLISKDLSGFHAGRLKLKYGPSNTYINGTETVSNNHFYSAVRDKLGLADNACWFVSDINIRNQDELILKTYILNKEGPIKYDTVEELHKAWSETNPDIAPYTDDDDLPEKSPHNIILYGVPGSGKSDTIKKEYCNNENYMERVVFHPDYTYSDFIGQLLPTNKNGTITYPFIPGPFTRILKKAISDPKNSYFLIIEELNRGNAPAIFGDIFQLLDRPNGTSDYGINNADIAKEVYLKETDKGNPTAEEEAAKKQIKLPANLFILATMNTADQNVFTLDTAFKRRWQMRRIKNDFNKCTFANVDICNESGLTWRIFAETVNSYIEQNSNNLGSEDKRLGAYFILRDDLQNKAIFSEKVIMYLWNDAFKYNHEDIFSSQFTTLDALLDYIETNTIESSFSDQFKKSISERKSQEQYVSNSEE